MRHLTHRANAHPAQITRQEMRRVQSDARRTIEGQKVHLSGRSMWRGYWYGKGVIAKWNRVEQVLTGMKWSYYTGKQVKTAQISLLENHHAATGAGHGLDGAAEKKDADGNSPAMHGRAKEIPRTTTEFCGQDARVHAHHMQETARFDNRISAPGAALIHAHEGLGAAGQEGEKRAASPHYIEQAPAGNFPASASEAPCSSICIGAPEARTRTPAGNHVPLSADAAAASERHVGRPRSGMMTGALGAALPASGADQPGAISIPAAIIAFSNALSSAASAIIRHAGIGGIDRGKSGKNNADSNRAGAGGDAIPASILPASANPTNTINAQSPAQDTAASGQAHGQGCGANEITRAGALHAHRPAAYVGAQKRKSFQLKVARADALPPQ